MAGSRCAAANSKNPLAVEVGERVGDHEDRVRHVADHRPERLIEIVGLVHAQRLHADPQRPGTRLRRPVPQRHAEVLEVPQHRHPAKLRRHLLEQLHPLGRDFRRHVARDPLPILSFSRGGRRLRPARRYAMACPASGERESFAARSEPLCDPLTNPGIEMIAGAESLDLWVEEFLRARGVHIGLRDEIGADIEVGGHLLALRGSVRGLDSIIAHAEWILYD